LSDSKILINEEDNNYWLCFSLSPQKSLIDNETLFTELLRTKGFTVIKLDETLTNKIHQLQQQATDTLYGIDEVKKRKLTKVFRKYKDI